MWITRFPFHVIGAEGIVLRRLSHLGDRCQARGAAPDKLTADTGPWEDKHGNLSLLGAYKEEGRWKIKRILLTRLHCDVTWKTAANANE